MIINIPENVSNILNKLVDSGFESFCVGGCVRDSIMNLPIHDWDLTTRATPEQIVALFSHTIPTGEKHGTITIVEHEENIEVTTFRTDGDYSDNRHPDKIVFSEKISDDLSRRDFTVNAMAYNTNVGLIDIFGGISDISNKVIRCVGDANTRFKEDSLRMLRAIRFSSKLGFSIHPDTFRAICDNADLIKNVSSERIRDEIVKIIMSDNAYDGILLLHETGLLKIIVPKLDICFGIGQDNPHHIFDIGEHIAHSVENSTKEINIRLTMLFHDIGKTETKTLGDDAVGHFYGHGEVSAEMTREIMRGLKFDNSTISTVTTLVLHHNAEIKPTGRSVRRWLSKIGEENFKRILAIRLADADAQNPDDFDNTKEEVDAIWKAFREVIEAKNAFSMKDLAINGKDLMNIGIPQDRSMGIILNALLDAVIENPELNNVDDLMGLVRGLWED